MHLPDIDPLRICISVVRQWKKGLLQSNHKNSHAKRPTASAAIDSLDALQAVPHLCKHLPLDAIHNLSTVHATGCPQV